MLFLLALKRKMRWNQMSDILMPIDMDLPYDKDFFKDYGVFVKPIDYPMS